ncbi:hypothetical protein BC826DRAFT_971984 [Russula brevipes]|nr:hypothetical protein BC826DRAFT_971984 [Russula brevipes]
MSDFTSFYDILPNDQLHKSYMAPLGGAYGMSLGGFSSYLPVGIKHTPSRRASSASWSTSLEPTPVTSFGPPHGQLPAYGELEADGTEYIPTSLGKRKQSGTTRRQRGPSKRSSGTGYVEMMGRLSPKVQEALKKEYGCCERVRESGDPNRMKHRFSKAHYSMGWQDVPGFREINEQVSVFPIEVTGAEFDAVQRHRQLSHRPGKETNFSVPVQRAVSKLLAVMIEGMYPNAAPDDSGASDAMDVTSGEQYFLPLGDGKVEECGDPDDFSWF